MRGSTIKTCGAGGRAYAAVSRPDVGVQRLVDAVSEVFAPRDTVTFTAVDGVFQPEGTAEHTCRPERPVSARAVGATRRAAPIRLYNARAREVLSEIAPKGTHIDVRA